MTRARTRTWLLLALSLCAAPLAGAASRATAPQLPIIVLSPQAERGCATKADCVADKVRRKRFWAQCITGQLPRTLNAAERVEVVGQCGRRFGSPDMTVPDPVPVQWRPDGQSDCEARVPAATEARIRRVYARACRILHARPGGRTAPDRPTATLAPR